MILPEAAAALEVSLYTTILPFNPNDLVTLLLFCIADVGAKSKFKSVTFSNSAIVTLTISTPNALPTTVRSLPNIE